VLASDGKEAIARLAEVAPDIVLADVFMPGASGYEVCEYIKQDAQLKHIPVMLLVGSFEPFDEAEARRVGADDILTKPFQSIRRLIDKVGGLVSGTPATDDNPTAEFPKVEPAPEIEKLSDAELEVTTADTQPLPVGGFSFEHAPAAADAPAAVTEAKGETLSETRDKHMERNGSSVHSEGLQDSDLLLELGDIGRLSNVSANDFVLDIDLNDLAQAPLAEVSSYNRHKAFPEPQISQPEGIGWRAQAEEADIQAESNASNSTTGTQDWMTADAVPGVEDRSEEPHEQYSTTELVSEESSKAREETSTAGKIDPSQLSPAIIEAIARRAVEQLSERVVQEIAWEVVPQLAELLIKRRLEEKDPQVK
jgi:CheY-like chemotaxis protein